MSKVFHGLDYKGRHEVPKHLKGCWYGPHIERGQVMSDEQIEAAHAATEVGADDDRLDGAWIVHAVIYGLVAWFAVAMVAVTVWGVK